jgi:hypothetical protein
VQGMDDSAPTSVLNRPYNGLTAYLGLETECSTKKKNYIFIIILQAFPLTNHFFLIEFSYVI